MNNLLPPQNPSQIVEQKLFELHGKGVGEDKISKTLGITRYTVRKTLQNPGSTPTDSTTNRSTAFSTGRPTGSTNPTTGSTGTTIATKPANQVIDIEKPKPFFPQ